MKQSPNSVPPRRQLPKLMACMTKTSLENLRNKMLFTMDMLDAKEIRRRQKPLHECLILELGEQGYVDSANYLQDLLYDNAQLCAEDDIGIVVDLRKHPAHLERICIGLQTAERQRERDNAKMECSTLLDLARFYAEAGKGILWLSEKFFLATIATASRYLLDGGRLKGVCKYYYSKFLLDKFPAGDPEEPFLILTDVRDCSIGKTWPLHEAEKEGEEVPSESLFSATAVQLHRVLLNKARAIRNIDIAKSERLSRLAERRGQDTGEAPLIAEAIVEVGICQLMMNNLNNAKKTFERAFKMYTQTNYIEGLCVTRMHLAAVMQRLNDHEAAARLLTEMGALAMEHGLRLQLGRALHFLGELHLRRERPDIGTQHLAEAFYCFMGSPCAMLQNLDEKLTTTYAKSGFGIIYKEETTEVYIEEADQSRLMMAISAGQELMASYYALIKEGKICAVAKVKCIEWKLSKNGWWLKRLHHELLPCMCPAHNRTPLDVLWYQLDLKAEAEKLGMERSEISNMILGRGDSVKDFQDLMSKMTLGHDKSQQQAGDLEQTGDENNEDKKEEEVKQEEVKKEEVKKEEVKMEEVKKEE